MDSIILAIFFPYLHVFGGRIIETPLSIKQAAQYQKNKVLSTLPSRHGGHEGFTRTAVFNFKRLDRRVYLIKVTLNMGKNSNFI